MEPKNPLSSLTIRGLLVVVLGMLVAQFGLPINAEVLADDIVEVGGALIQLIGLVTATVGRYRASQPLA